MSRKKVSGQTITIIILVILLILVIGFGGVYAYYSSRSNIIIGRVSMANLSITLNTDDGSGVSSGSSNLIMTSSCVMPGQSVKNNPLTITNNSNADTYIVVVYKVEGFTGDDPDTNIISAESGTISGYDTSVWTDYYYQDSYTSSETGMTYTADFRCLIALAYFPESEGDVITVIGEDCLKIPSDWGNEFQDLIISFHFQAYAIGAHASYGDGQPALSVLMEDASTVDAKCGLIASAVWNSFDYNISL